MAVFGSERVQDLAVGADDDPALAGDGEVLAEGAEELGLAVRAVGDLLDDLGGAVVVRGGFDRAVVGAAARVQVAPDMPLAM
ncbi:hypothetical protein [Streptomyces sp. NRRL F-5635]|uniref:hypothetical protein n=1 Tax=Streptomyces sp. NRRL F-5635 TaxID=1463865 RepID=UPI0004CD9716|nr:hypothetical protein [Streptomyces sp. NRRL F-5635]